MRLAVREAVLWKGFLRPEAQAAMVAEVRQVMAVAPPVRPVTRRGRKMSVAMTSAGAYGWVTDRRGYRYEAAQADGSPWPNIPEPVLEVWEAVSGVDRSPESCLINFYRDGARMGLHQDRDEADLDMPVVSISLGDAALFRIGNVVRGGPTESVWLESGDVIVLGGGARLRHHGIDRVETGSSPLIPGGGRINLTLRVVT